MTKPIFLGGLALAAALSVGTWSLAQDVQALRTTAIDQPGTVDTELRWVAHEGRLQRNYRQQPPLIPHPIDNYQIDLRTNQCLSCHDWSVAGERGAPTLSMTHYLDREGNELDVIAGTRYFCNQCHVAQADTPALVENDFVPSSAN